LFRRSASVFKYFLPEVDGYNRSICPVIPSRSNPIDKPEFFAKLVDKARARLEQMMGKIKRFKRIALRHEKTARNYASFLALVCVLPVAGARCATARRATGLS
jgi:transposase